jgi:hypothetical protein
MRPFIPPMSNLFLQNPEGERLHWNWVTIKPETERVFLFCEHMTAIFVRLTPHDERVLFAHYTHTTLCLCVLSQVRTVPGVLLQLQVPPPYSLLPAQATEENCELFTLRRTRWTQGETPVSENGWNKPSFLLGYNDHQFMVNHCPPSCRNFG